MNDVIKTYKCSNYFKYLYSDKEGIKYILWNIPINGIFKGTESVGVFRTLESTLHENLKESARLQELSEVTCKIGDMKVISKNYFKGW